MRSRSSPGPDRSTGVFFHDADVRILVSRRPSRRQVLGQLATVGGVATAGCSVLGGSDTGRPVEIEAIWLFNADSTRERTVNLRLYDGQRTVIDDMFRLDPKAGDVAGSERVDARIPDAPRPYRLVAWTPASADRKSRIDVAESVQGDCTVVDVSVTADRPYPAIFLREDCPRARASTRREPPSGPPHARFRQVF